MSNDEITATFRIAATVIGNQAAGAEPFIYAGWIDVAEMERRIERARRLAECAKYGVPVVSVQMRNVSRIARLLGVRI